MKRWLLLVLSLAWASVALAQGGAAHPLTERLDLLERQGRDSPREALAALAQLPLTEPKDLLQRQISQGVIHAANGDDARARAIAEQLRHADPKVHGDMGLVAYDLVLAQLAQIEAQPELAARHAKTALKRLETPCATLGPGCDLPRLWLLHRLAGDAARAMGLLDEAQRHVDTGLRIATSAKDAYRQVLSLIAQATIAKIREQLDVAETATQQARALADQVGDPVLKVRVLQFTAEMQRLRHDLEGMRTSLEESLALAQAAQLKRETTYILINLSDLELRAKRPTQALRWLEQARPEQLRFKDRRIEATIKHNMGLARLALGQLEAGKRDVEAGLALWADSGAREELSLFLQEYSVALADAGDVPGALAAYHRERKLKNEALAADREAALAALRQQHNPNAQKREIELQARENAVRQALLDNHAARQRFWVWLSVVGAVVAPVLALLLHRMRLTQRLLKQRQAELRAQSEQDALTGLANRRSLNRSIQAAQGPGGGYQGGVLLVDLDHFKHINDGHGHCAGDIVLQEVARRLQALVQADEVVGRWGGEEFAIHLPGASPARTAELAEAVLLAIGGTAIGLPTEKLRVTASVGFGTYPLPQQPLQVGWEQALNLADMALYQAKSQGRNQAMGLVAVQADSPKALAAIEADFESATRQGRAQLMQIPGPLP
ncbi:MAG: hypothetical protein C4K60_19920 [Ideonella sp. MAG2]|nr:MAG: hypothetical protein C4K60_19920 [Ideonella sp. MAG2]